MWLAAQEPFFFGAIAQLGLLKRVRVRESLDFGRALNQTFFAAFFSFEFQTKFGALAYLLLKQR